MATVNLFCTICFENYKSTDDIVCSSCGHVFHNTCWNNWLSHSMTCPDCRSPKPQAQPIYLHINEPSMSKKKLVQQLEESEQDFLSALAELKKKDDQFYNVSNELELQNAKIASYEHELSEIKDALGKSEKALIAVIKKKELEIEQLTSKLNVMNCLCNSTILNDEDKSDAKVVKS